MNKTQHFFEDSIYLISNRAVARNSLFDIKERQEDFIGRMEKYLSPICKILAYSLKDDEFQLLVKLGSRNQFTQHFLSKKKNRDLKLIEIPDTTYIFSQTMANFQVSFVKHYNFINGRSGALMAGRFGRKLIETAEELKYWIDQLNKGVTRHNYGKDWSDRARGNCAAMTSLWMYNVEKGAKGLTDHFYVNYKNINLEGYFRNLPPKKLEDISRYFKMRFNQLFGPKPGPFI